MKRYFDDSKEELVMEVHFTPKGMEYSVPEVEKALKVKGLREINKEEFGKLKKDYQNGEVIN